MAGLNISIGTPQYQPGPINNTLQYLDPSQLSPTPTWQAADAGYSAGLQGGNALGSGITAAAGALGNAMIPSSRLTQQTAQAQQALLPQQTANAAQALGTQAVVGGTAQKAAQYTSGRGSQYYGSNPYQAGALYPALPSNSSPSHAQGSLPIPTVTDQSDFDNLKSGAAYYTPFGKLRIKP